jgi:Domain of unknown function (DUF4399)
MKKFAFAAIIALLAMPAIAQETPSPEGAVVYLIGLEDGMTVKGPVTVRFGLTGMGVAPAETVAENTGHHHLLIDRAPFGSEDAEELTLAIPDDDNHKHFGKGQTEVTLDLEPGVHTLQLVLGDHGHVPHVPPVMSEQITITVE